MTQSKTTFRKLKIKALWSLKAAKDSSNSTELKQLLMMGSKACGSASRSDTGFFYNIAAVETIVKANGDIVGTFEIGPLETGYGVTLGSTLRRVILGARTGSAITSFKINDAKHEFSVIQNIKEDILDIAFNLKSLRLKAGALKNPVIGYACITGPQIVTGGMLRFPKKTVKVLNADQYICTVTDKVAILEVEVSSATSYEQFSDLTDEKNSATLSSISTTANPVFMRLDANFNSVKAVSYKVKLGHDEFGILSDIVEFTVTTNGTCSPLRIIIEGAKEILDLFYPLVAPSNMLKKVTNVI